MNERSIHLDRVEIDGHRMHRRSATLRLWGEAPDADWTVDLACAIAPDEMTPSGAIRRMEATTADGGHVDARIRIVDRLDDEYGTRMLLVGSGTVPGSAERSSVEP
ncbi:MAG: hypothetical protein K5924_06170 [Chloroflexi bacterium]|nr:hypothetical protein [Chloroflexota bacterium]